MITSEPRWGVFEVIEHGGDEEDLTLLHVAPTFGREHILSPYCWCHPEIDDNRVITHNVMH